MECPTIRQVTEKLGWFANPSRTEYDLSIHGAGPAGLSAAVYGSSALTKGEVVYIVGAATRRDRPRCISPPSAGASTS
jgi:ribulose 1,5-bisphosphate synthetase/thiazole synthase